MSKKSRQLVGHGLRLPSRGTLHLSFPFSLAAAIFESFVIFTAIYSNKSQFILIVGCHY